MNVIHRWQPPAQKSRRNNGFFSKVRAFMRQNGDTASSKISRHFGRSPQATASILFSMRKRGQVEVVGREVRSNVWRVT